MGPEVERVGAVEDADTPQEGGLATAYASLNLNVSIPSRLTMEHSDDFSGLAKQERPFVPVGGLPNGKREMWVKIGEGRKEELAVHLKRRGSGEAVVLRLGGNGVR